MKGETEKYLRDIELLSSASSLEEAFEVEGKLGTTQAKEYVNALRYRSRLETLISTELIEPVFHTINVSLLPQPRVENGWVDYYIKYAHSPPVLLEIKPMHRWGGDRLFRSDLKDTVDYYKVEYERHRTNQVVKYLSGKGEDYSGGAYVILTNGVKVYYFNRSAISGFDFFKEEDFSTFIRDLSDNPDIWDLVHRKDQQKERKNLDKEFFADLVRWKDALVSLKWKENPLQNSVRLLNRLIFVRTLEDFSVIDFNHLLSKYRMAKHDYGSKGPSRVIEKFFGEMHDWFYIYYDTELFKPENNATNYIVKNDPENMSEFLKVLDGLIGAEAQLSLFERGLITYDFTFIDEDIFGKAYELFLAKNRQEKGIYYTPREATEYIAEATVNEVFGSLADEIINALNNEHDYYLADKLCDRFVNLSVLDPSCGSGPFLVQSLRKIIGVYEKIRLETEWVNSLGDALTLPDDVFDRVERTRKIRRLIGIDKDSYMRDLLALIPLRHLYGIDLDRSAIEVAKVNIWKESIKLSAASFRFGDLTQESEHILPDLSCNIVVGNSLVTLPKDELENLINSRKTDLRELIEQRNEYLSHYNEPSRMDGLRPLRESIHEEGKSSLDLGCDKCQEPIFLPIAFPHLYLYDDGERREAEDSGFDIIIGNPPYIKEFRKRDIFEPVKNSGLSEYYLGKMDYWYFFTSLAIDNLKKHGINSFVAETNWITNSGAKKLRNKILKETMIKRFVNFGSYRLFDEVGNQFMIYILEKDGVPAEYTMDYYCVETNHAERDPLFRDLREESNSKIFRRENIIIRPNDMIDSYITFIRPEIQELIDKIHSKGNYKFTKDDLSTGIDVHQDFVTIDHLKKLEKNGSSDIRKGDGIFVLSETEVKALRLTPDEERIIKPYYTASELDRYYGSQVNKLRVIYSNREVRQNIVNYPNIKLHFDKFKDIITSDFGPYGLHRSREERFFIGEKIMCLRKTLHPHFSYTDFPCYVSQSFIVIKPESIDLLYLTGVLNSKLMEFWLRHKGKLQGDQLQIDYEPLRIAPIIKPVNDEQKRLSEQISSRVKKIIDMIKDSVPQAEIQRKAEEIDDFVYALYGITNEEIDKIITDMHRAPC